ncbi:MAG: DUF5320 domain-containing protein [Acidobacteriota bacterium]|nr:DUF5320 domain-containing protein [Acidobacteriota bacterium]
MPLGDRTGPAGMGPMTGRGMGYCAGYGVPGYMNPGFGRFGAWGGRGGGRGWRNWYYASGQPGWSRAAMGLPAWGGAAPYYGPVEMTPDQEVESLKKGSGYLKQELNNIQKRIKTLEKEETKDK